MLEKDYSDNINNNKNIKWYNNNYYINNNNTETIYIKQWILIRYQQI